MKELLQTYSITEILLFIVLLAIAVKGVITFYDWAKERLGRGFQKEFQKKASHQNILDSLKQLSEQIEDVNQHHKQDRQELLDNIKELKDESARTNKTVAILVNSDKDDIKSWITEKHHYFCYEKKVIDDFSLDCIEKRYGHYQEEGGNSYISTLMKEIRALPKVSLIYDEKEEDSE